MARLEIEESSDFAYFLGVILGDSGISERAIKFTSRDAEFRAKFVEIGTKIIGKKPRVYKRDRNGYVETIICFFCAEFIHGLESWLNLHDTSFGSIFGSKSHNSDPGAFIKIYKFVQKTKENAKAFIEGFYDSEGSCCRFKRTRKSGFISHYHEILICNTNRELLQFVQTMLLDFFQIEGKLNLMHSKNAVVYWPSNEEQPFIRRTKDCWSLRITRKASLNEFAQYIHSSIPRKNLSNS